MIRRLKISLGILIAVACISVATDFVRHPGCTRILRPSSVALTCIDASAALGMMACGDVSGDIHLIRLADWTYIATIHHLREVSAIAFSRGGSQLLAGDIDGLVVKYNLADGSTAGRCAAHSSKIVRVAFGSSGTVFLTEGALDNVAIWETEGMKEMVRVERESPGVQLPSACFASTDAEVVTAAWFEAEPSVWDAHSGHKIAQMPKLANWYPAGPGFAGVVSCSTNGLLATGTWRWHLIFWDIGSRTPLADVKPFARPVINIDFSEDGKVLAAAEETGSWRAPREIVIYETGSFSVIRRIRQRRSDGASADIKCICLPGNGRIILTAHEDGTLRVWVWS